MYLAAYIVLGFLLILSIKIPTRGNAQTGFINAMVVVAGAALVRTFCSINMVNWIPEQGSLVHMGLVIAASFLTIVILVIWRFALPILTTLFCSIATTGGLFALAIYVPQLSERFLPEGPTLAEFVGMASDTIKESKENAKEMAALLNKGKELQDKPGAFASALQAIAELTSEDEMDSLQSDFNAGVEFWRERKEMMDNMSPEEKEAYRREMAAFLNENGLSENRYSLSEIKNVSKEDLMNAASFMGDLNAEYGIEDKPMPPEEAAKASDSLAKIAKNLKGGSLSRLEKDSIGKLVQAISDDGLDGAIEQAKKDMDEFTGGSQVTGALFATLLELKSGISAMEIITEAQLVTAEKKQAARAEGATDPDATTESTNVSEPAEESDGLDIVRRSSENTAVSKTAAPDLSKIEVPDWVIPEGMEGIETQRGLGMILIPESMPKKKNWIQASEGISVKGFVVSGAQGEDVRAIIGKTTIGLSDKFSIRHDAKSYTFKVSDIAYGRLYITAISVH